MWKRPGLRGNGSPVPPGYSAMQMRPERGSGARVQVGSGEETCSPRVEVMTDEIEHQERPAPPPDPELEAARRLVLQAREKAQRALQRLHEHKHGGSCACNLCQAGHHILQATSWLDQVLDDFY